HHLVVDGVSWRILVPDLVSAWRQLGEGVSVGQVQLPPVGTSYRRWAEELLVEARRPEREDEADLWLDLLEGSSGRIGDRPFDPTVDTSATARAAAFRLDPEATELLLTRAPKAFRCGPDEVLLAGLAVAVAQWRRQRGITDGDDGTVLIDVEGHGREPLVEGLDLSRTVGWFTSIYPVRLDPGPVEWAEVRAGGDAISTVVRRAKEQVRRLPDKGAGYGLLRYLNPHTGPLLAEAPAAE